MRRRRGYTLLIAMLLVAAALLLMMGMLDLGGGEQLSEGAVRNQDQALAIAEVGTERTYAFLNELLAVDGDFDRALDPNLDDDCSTLPITRNTGEDHLPPFPDGTAVQFGGANQWFMEVPSAGGAYLVRIDDDEDDQVGVGQPWATNNHYAGIYRCQEGVGVENLVRDDNRTVVVTVVGIYPGTDVTHPQSQETLRVTVGPPAGPGLIAGGNVSLGGRALVGGLFDNVAVAGDATLALVTGGATVQASGTCSAGGLPAPTCQSDAVLPALPLVDPWDVTNAPYPCTFTACTPYYYARYDQTDQAARVWDWNWALCPNPRAYSRICYPHPQSGQDDMLVGLDGGGTLCESCWTLLYAGPPDGGFGHDQVKASPMGAPIFTALPMPNRFCASDPDPGAAPMWPNSQWPGTVFAAAAGSSPPPGVWFLEGNLNVIASWGAGVAASLDVLGTVELFGSGDISLIPAAPKGYVLLAGKDLLVAGTGVIIGPASGPSAVMVHEQLGLGANSQINGEVVVANRATCDGTVTAIGALTTFGNMQLINNFPGPIPLGPAVAELAWSPSSL